MISSEAQHLCRTHEPLGTISNMTTSINSKTKTGGGGKKERTDKGRA